MAMNFDKLEPHLGGTGAAHPTAAMVAPGDTRAAQEGVHFEEHGLIKASVEEKVRHM
jgi:hypothetical protein